MLPGMNPRRILTLLQTVFPSSPMTELVYCGRKLKDDLTLESYGIQSGSTVHILRRSWPEPVIHPGESMQLCMCSSVELKSRRQAECSCCSFPYKGKYEKTETVKLHKRQKAT